MTCRQRNVCTLLAKHSLKITRVQTHIHTHTLKHTHVHTQAHTRVHDKAKSNFILYFLIPGSYTTRNILIIVGCVAVFLLLVALGAYLLLKSNYHLIFIPKEVSANDEWGTPDK